MATVTSASTHQEHSTGWGWVFKHPVTIGGLALSVVFFGVLAGFYAEAVPFLTGLPGIVMLFGFFYVAICMTLLLEGGRDPATR